MSVDAQEALFLSTKIPDNMLFFHTFLRDPIYFIATHWPAKLSGYYFRRVIKVFYSKFFKSIAAPISCKGWKPG
jgi:hypothetical protein